MFTEVCNPVFHEEKEKVEYIKMYIDNMFFFERFYAGLICFESIMKNFVSNS